MTVDQKFDQRLSRLEATVEGLAGEVNNTVKSINRLAEVVSRRGETQWPVLIGAVTLVLGIVGSVGFVGVGQPMQEVKADLHRLMEKQHAHELLPGHAATIHSVSIIEDGLRDFNTVLRREMRLLDEVLQTKAMLSDQVLEERLNTIREKFDTVMPEGNRSVKRFSRPLDR